MTQFTSKEKAVLSLLEEGEKAVESYFFSKIKGTDLKWFRPLMEKGYFDPSQNPPPYNSGEEDRFIIPFWPALQYLEKISDECSKPENREYAEELLGIIRNVTRPQEGNRIDNYRTWSVLARILSNIPNSLIQESDMELVGDWLETESDTSVLGSSLSKRLLPKLLNSDQPGDWRKATKLIQVVTSIRDAENGSQKLPRCKESHTALDSYSLKILFKENSTNLGKKAGKDLVPILVRRIEESLTSESDDDLSYIWRGAIEDHEQNVFRDDARNIFISALRDLLVAFTSQQSESGKSILYDLLQHELKLVRRISLYVVNVEFYQFKVLFWKILDPTWFQSVYFHEMYQLLNNRFSIFDSTQQNQLIDIIEDLSESWPPEENADRLNKINRLRWLEAIQGKGNARADQVYQEYIFETEIKNPKHPDFVSYSEIRVGNLTPCTAEDLLSREISDIVAYLNEFSETGQWDDPTEEGLAHVLMDAVKEKPEKFEGQLFCFLDVKLGYQYELLHGFEKAWGEKRIFNWDKVLEFCQKIIDQDRFWNLGDAPPDKNLRARRSWITSQICNLISGGTKDDAWAFDKSLLPKAEKIILNILAKEPSTTEFQEEDGFMQANNSPKGRCIVALINYSLRNARLIDKLGNDKTEFWDQIKPVFDGELDLCRDGNYEFSALAGDHIFQLYYLSNNWVEDNFNKIFSLEYERNWLFAMQGYSYVNRVDPVIYDLFKRNGHLEKVIRQTEISPQIREKIIEHVSFQYLEGEETLEGENPFSQILQQWKEDDITEVASLFWEVRKWEVSQKRNRRILDFWKWCSKKIDKATKENSKILSNLSLLTFAISKVTPAEQSLLEQSVPFAEINWNSSFVLEYLDGLVEDYPQAVGKAFLAMLQSHLPTFDEKNIRSIVDKLYKAGFKAEAKKIANIYSEKGHEFLRQIYDENNS